MGRIIELGALLPLKDIVGDDDPDWFQVPFDTTVHDVIQVGRARYYVRAARHVISPGNEGTRCFARLAAIPAVPAQPPTTVYERLLRDSEPW